MILSGRMQHPLFSSKNLLTAITQLVRHGLIFVPIGYTFEAGMFEMEKVKGGSPYGARTFAGDGSRQPFELELEQACHHGKYFASIAKKLKAAALFSYIIALWELLYQCLV